MAAKVVRRFKQCDVCLALQAVGHGQARNARTDDGEFHGWAQGEQGSARKAGALGAGKDVKRNMKRVSNFVTER